MLIHKLLAVTAVATLAFLGSASAQEATFSTKSLKPEIAVELAQAALADCRKRGFQVAVSVVDRAGNLQVTIRDQLAGAHTPETARRKAWSAVSFRTPTLELESLIKSGELSPTILHVPGALMVGGGVPVEAAGSILGGIGISGAPGGDHDQACALAGIESIADKIEF